MRCGIMFCPNCSDPWDGKPITLKEYEGVLYCPGPDGDGGCDFHYDIKSSARFTYVDKKPVWFWTILCIITFFNVSVQRKEWQ